jgi:hypothetical protein
MPKLFPPKLVVTVVTVVTVLVSLTFSSGHVVTPVVTAPTSGDKGVARPGAGGDRGGHRWHAGRIGKVAAAHLIGADAAQIDVLNELVRRHLSAVVTAAAEDARERALSLRAGPPAAPLLRTLRRVRSDVAFLGRAMALQPGRVEVATSEALARYFTEAVAFLRGTGSAPALKTLDDVIGCRPIACSVLAGDAPPRPR